MFCSLICCLLGCLLGNLKASRIYVNETFVCDLCGVKGPAKRTGHERCRECTLCGMCCIECDRCGASTAMFGTEPKNPILLQIRHIKRDE